MISLPTRACNKCGRQIAWVRSENGKPVPIDPEPNDAGNCVLDYHDGRLRLRVQGKGEPLEGVKYMPHFGSCPVLLAVRKPPKPRKAKPTVEQPALEL